MFIDVHQAREYLLKNGDILLSRSGTLGRAFVFSESEHPPCAYAGYLVRFVPTPRLNPRYLLYFSWSLPFSDWIQTQVIASTIGNVNGQKYAQCSLPLPMRAEQDTIVQFLDRETARLDRLVAKKRELIERLKEKRTALISRTVTRGLPPSAARAAGLPENPPLKPSGIDWVGDIPAHWSVKPLKHLASQTRDSGIQIGPFGGMLTELQYDDDGEFKVYGQENTLSGDFSKGQRWLSHSQYLELSKYHVALGDVLFTRKGSIGGCAVVPSGVRPGIFDSDTIRLRVNNAVLQTAFVLYAFRFSVYLQAQVQEIKRGAILSGLNTSTIANLTVAVPPVPEQTEISMYLDKETSLLDALVAKVEAAIERLQEYRTALITAAVTGKIDIRAEVGP